MVGPTGSGKSALSLELARRFGGEIINCDSLQVYRHFDIGTAKTTLSERQAIPHHLIDIAEPVENFTAGDYQRLARRVAAEIAGRGRIPVVVGGTGFYLRAMLDGLFEGPGRDEALRARLNERAARRPGVLHRYLRRLDPAAARRIHANDRNKLVRAIEICLTAAQPVTRLYDAGSKPLEGFRVCQIGLDPPRAELYSLLDERCGRMFEAGLLEEVRRILAMGYPRAAKPFESLGYKHALRILDGVCTFDQALEDMRKETRHYAKRQWTWFKRDPRVVWIAAFGGSPVAQDQANFTIENFLGEDGTNPAGTRK